MREDSPSSFVRFKPRAKPDAYATALVLVQHVAPVCEHGKARPYLRHQLDRLATQVVLGLARGDWDVAANRWRHARRVLDIVRECGALLDIMIAQQAGPEPSLTDARDTTRVLARMLAAQGGIAV